MALAVHPGRLAAPRTETVGTPRAWATYSTDRQYRYALGRVWDIQLPRCAFVMLNPSTATETALDPTVRRCLGFARSWGYGSLEVGNLFGLRSTDPSHLYACSDAVGEANDSELEGIALRAQRVVCAWGNHGRHLGRYLDVKEILGRYHELYSLGITQEGQPLHPLYVAADRVPSIYADRRAP